MRKSVLWSLFGVAGVISFSLIGCGDSDDKPVPSKSGESCARTSDCEGSLVCISNVCLTPGTRPTPSAGGEGGGGPTLPVLGGLGETCSARSDCEPGLGCFEGRCLVSAPPPPPPEGGAPSVILGKRGEICSVAADCEKGLTCIPITGQSIGRCDIAEYPIEPTGKVCGAECKTADDCCEMPISIQAKAATAAGATAGALKSCEDLSKWLDGIDCATTTVATMAELCFIQSAYCTCAKDTWSCSSEGLCQYTADCSKNGLTLDGCATHSRSGRELVSQCNADTKQCEPLAAASQCKKDGDCLDATVADDPADTCSKGECTCYTATHLCYRKCSQDIDCAVGKSCNTSKHVCEQNPSCSSDRECITRLADVTAKCVDGTQCKIPCSTDHACSGSGTQSGGGAFTKQVCSSEGYCENIGCADDNDCEPVGGVRVFCSEQSAPAAGSQVSSAITN